MYWFWIAIISPILLAGVNHIDKYILSRLKGRGVEAIFLFSAILAFGTLPIVFVLGKEFVFNFTFLNAFILFLSGILGSVGLLLYLHSVFKEEISLSIAVFQLNPVWSYILGAVFLGEFLVHLQIVASLIIILGVFIITLDFEELKLKRFIFRRSVLFYMGVASVLYALQDVMFKYVVVNEGAFWSGVFWQLAGVLFFGILFYVFKPSSQIELKNFLLKNNTITFKINVFAEMLYLSANIINTFSLLLAPVALISVVGSSQPLFVFLGSLLIAKFLPKISSERLSKGHVLHKLASIFIIIVGSYMLYIA